MLVDREAALQKRLAIRLAMAEAERTGLPGVAVQLGATTAQGKAGERQAAIDSAFASQCVSEATAVLDCDPTVCAVCDRFILKLTTTRGSSAWRTFQNHGKSV